MSRQLINARAPVVDTPVTFRPKCSKRRVAASVSLPTTAVKYALRSSRPRLCHGRLVGLLSENVARDAQLSVFEALAGRAAMVGFVFAAALETTTQEALFPSSSLDGLGMLAAGCIAVSIATGVGFRQTIGDQLCDSVLSSLTAAQRSAASFTVTANLDEALDAVMSRTFDTTWTAQLTSADMLEDDFP